MGQLSSADRERTETGKPRVMGSFPLLWEEVTRLSSAKSNSVIKPEDLGGRIWFSGAAEGRLVGCGRVCKKPTDEQYGVRLHELL